MNSGVVDYIKMDIEGAKCQALEGARNTILNNKPLMAICVYHKWDDLIRVISKVLKYRKDYKVYIFN